ncbi:hypothetical protein HDZ31DRAFT_79494 [Schizophyllum fasciatum]
MPVDKNRKPRQSANDVKIPRPPNAWILFRSHQSRERRKNADSSKQQPAQSVVSSEISRMWKELSVEERRHWERMAEREADRHKKLHPNYKYQPQKKEDKERERELKKLEKEQARRERDAAAARNANAKGKGRRTLAAPRCVPSNAPVASMPFSIPYNVPGYTPDSTDADFASYGPLGPSPPVSAASSPEPDRDWPDASANSVSPPSSGPALTPLLTPYHTPQVESDASSASSISPITFQHPHGPPLPPAAPASTPQPGYVPPQSIQLLPGQMQRIPSGASSALPHTPMATTPSFEQMQQQAQLPPFQQQPSNEQLEQNSRLQQAIEQEQQRRNQQAPTPAVTPASDWSQPQLPPLSHAPSSHSIWQDHQSQDMSTPWEAQAQTPPQWQGSMDPATGDTTNSQGAWSSQSTEHAQQELMTFDIPDAGGPWPTGGDENSHQFAPRLAEHGGGPDDMLGGLRLAGTDHPEMFMVEPENWDLNPDALDLNMTIPILNPSLLQDAGLDFSFTFPETLPDTTSTSSYDPSSASQQYPQLDTSGAGPSSRPMSTQPGLYDQSQPDASYVDYRYGDEFINYDGGAGPSSRPAPVHSQSTSTVPQPSATSSTSTYTPPAGAQNAGVRRVGGAWRRPRPAVEQEAAPPCGVPAN